MRVDAAIVAVFFGVIASSALATTDAAQIAQATGLTPEVQGEVVRVSVPRTRHNSASHQP